MASWLVRLTPDRVVWVQALAGVIVLLCPLCPLARHFTFTMLLFTQMYNGYQKICWGLPCDELASHSGGSNNTPGRFMLRNQT